MSTCMNCGGILNKEAHELSTHLQGYYMDKHLKIIISDYFDTSVKALHDDHYICDSCISMLYYVAVLQDTYISNCPVCGRTVIIGTVAKSNTDV